jgi:hypothetical protein
LIPVDTWLSVDQGGGVQGNFGRALLTGGWRAWADIHVYRVLEMIPELGIMVDCPFGKWTPANHSSPRPVLDGWIRMVRANTHRQVTNVTQFVDAFNEVGPQNKLTFYTGDYYPETTQADIYASWTPFMYFPREITVLVDGMAGRADHSWMISRFGSGGRTPIGIESIPPLGGYYDSVAAPWLATGLVANWMPRERLNTFRHPGTILWRGEQDGSWESVVELVASKPGRRLCLWVNPDNSDTIARVREVISRGS